MTTPGDKAIASLVKWCHRDPWAERFQELLADHLAPVCEEMDVDPEELPSLLGLQQFSNVLGCVYEDLFTRVYPPDDANIIDEYLKRRGWKESAANRRYLQQLRDSVMSVWEVVDHIPGREFRARDLVCGGEPVTVVDKLASSTVRRWDRIAMRVMPFDDKMRISGAVLPLSFRLAAEIIEDVEDLRKDLRRRLRRVARQEKIDPELVDEVPLAEAVLSQSAPLVSGAWLEAELERRSEAAVPVCYNTDRELLVCCEVRFPLADAADPERVIACLDGIAALNRRHDEVTRWTWRHNRSGGDDRGADATAEVPAPGRLLDSRDELGPYLGTVRLEDDVLVLDVNSRERAARGQTMLTQTLGDLLGPPSVSEKTLEELMAERHEAAPPPPEPDLPELGLPELGLPESDLPEPELPEPELPEDVKKRLITEYLDRHYRDTLSHPVPALDGKSPRQAVRSKAGRKRVVEWLKELENHGLRSADIGALPAYDFTWMWEELKITHLRE